MDSFGRVWDLRTGRCIMFLEGHLKSVLGIDFSPNGLVSSYYLFFVPFTILLSCLLECFCSGIKLSRVVKIIPAKYGMCGKGPAFTQFQPTRIWYLAWNSSLQKEVLSLLHHMTTLPRFVFMRFSHDYTSPSRLIIFFTLQLWLSSTWQPLKTLKGHDGRVMSVDISRDGQYIATSSFDRTFKLWAPEL